MIEADMAPILEHKLKQIYMITILYMTGLMLD